MGSPNQERAIILSRLDAGIRNFVENLRDEIQAGRAAGTPDSVIIKGILGAQELTDEGKPVFPTNSTMRRKRGMVDDIQGRIRQVYSTAQANLGAALDRPIPFDGILPTSQGYEVPENFKDPLDRALARAEVRAERMEDEFQRDVVANKGLVRMIWIAAFVNTCKDCIRLAGQTKTFEEWERSGFWPGNGRTVCGENCQCHLAPARAIEERFNIRQRDAQGNLFSDEKREGILKTMLENGIKLQNKKIDELVKRRGEDYAESTRLQFLGKIRSDEFNPGFEKREAVFKKKVPKSIGNKFKEQAKKRTFRT